LVELNGNTTIDGNLTVNGNTTLGNAGSDTLRIYSSDVELNKASAGTNHTIKNTNAASDLILETTSDIILNPTNNVGIGTTSPNQLLHTVGGTVKVESDGGSASGAVLELKHANNNTTDVCATINFTNNVGGYAAIEGGTTGANNTGYLAFKTDNAGTQGEAMRVIGNGNVGIGTTTPSQPLTVAGNISGSGDINIDGDGYVDGTLTAGRVVETSTRELKENIQPLKSQKEVVDSLQPVSYTWKEGGEKDFGLIAEDVAEIAPDLVSYDEEGKLKGIKYSKLSVLLLDVVKKQNSVIEELSERITKLETNGGK